MTYHYRDRRPRRRVASYCQRQGHVVVRIGPYLICRTLSCPRLVVEVVR